MKLKGCSFRFSSSSSFMFQVGSKNFADQQTNACVTGKGGGNFHLLSMSDSYTCGWNSTRALLTDETN